MSNIESIGTITALDLSVNQVLEGGKDKLDSCLLIGFDKDGELYCASTMHDGGDIIWLLEACKRKLFECIESYCDE